MRIAAIIMTGMTGALAVSTSAFAQNPAASNTEQVAQYSTDKLTSELSLTPDQVPKVQKINVASTVQMEKLLDKYSADTTLAGSKALVKGLITVIRSNQTELKKVLTPAQWTLHQQHKAERLALSQTEFMAADLDLTRQQILDVSRINLETANKLVRALDKPLSAAKPTPQAIAEAARPAMDERDVALNRVLTADQLSKMQYKRRVLREVLLEEASSPNPSAAAAAPKPKP